LVVGQYFRIRRRYASIDIEGMCLAWKESREDGWASDVRDAENVLRVGSELVLACDGFVGG
jgi:hypothetical protein